jgi:hypothetical protein
MKAPLLFAPRRYEPEARLKNGVIQDVEPSRNHDPRGSAPLHLKNDFAIHDFVKPPPAL